MGGEPSESDGMRSAQRRLGPVTNLSGVQVFFWSLLQQGFVRAPVHPRPDPLRSNRALSHSCAPAIAVPSPASKSIAAPAIARILRLIVSSPYARVPFDRQAVHPSNPRRDDGNTAAEQPTGL
jgi:hypothetical protein